MIKVCECIILLLLDDLVTIQWLVALFAFYDIRRRTTYGVLGYGVIQSAVRCIAQSSSDPRA